MFKHIFLCYRILNDIITCYEVKYNPCLNRLVVMNSVAFTKNTWVNNIVNTKELAAM